MPISRNVGGRDRQARAVLAVLAGLAAVAAFLRDAPAVAGLAAAVAVGLGFNAVTCVCGLNAALGIDTTDE